MTIGGITRSVVEHAALAWLESNRWQARNGTEIAPDEPAAERDDYGQVCTAQQLREASRPLVFGDLWFGDADMFVESAA